LFVIEQQIHLSKPITGAAGGRLGMNLEKFCYEIKTARQHSARLYFEARKSLVQQQGLLVEAFEVLDNALEKLQVAEKELCQQNNQLAAVRESVEVERQRYQKLLEFAPDAYIVTDKQGIIKEANRAAAKLLNIPHCFLAGKPLIMLVSHEQRRTLINKLIWLHQWEQGQEWEFRLQPRNSEPCDATLTLTSVQHQDGKPIAVGWVLRCITEHKQAESTALCLVKSAMQHVNEPIIITSAQLNEPGPKFVFVNPAFTKMTGYTMEELSGKTPRILQGPKTDRSVLAQLRKNLAQGQIFEGETINYHKDGSEYKVEMHCSPIRNERGEITHFISRQRHSPLEQADFQARY